MCAHLDKMRMSFSFLEASQPVQQMTGTRALKTTEKVQSQKTRSFKDQMWLVKYCVGILEVAGILSWTDLFAPAG